MPRLIGAFNASYFSDPNLVPFEFLTMVFAAPVGTLYWTNYPADSLVLDIDDGSGSHTWDGTREFTIGQFEQGEQSMLSISDVTFGNGNNEFSDIVKQFAYGVRGVAIDVSYGGFTNTEPHTFIESIRYFSGVMNRAEVGDDVRVSILAFDASMTRKYPHRRFTTAHGFFWIPKPNLKIMFGTAQYPLPSQTRPNAPNTPPTTPWVPPPGAPGPTGRQRPRTVPPRGAPPTADRGRRTRRVNR